MRAGRKYEISSPEKILMILRNEETNSEILLQFFFVSWAKYYFMMSQCVRVLAGLWWFLYQIFQVSCLLAGNNIMGINYWHSCFSRPSQPPPAGRDQDVNLQVHWIRSSLPGNISQHLPAGSLSCECCLAPLQFTLGSCVTYGEMTKLQKLDVGV